MNKKLASLIVGGILGLILLYFILKPSKTLAPTADQNLIQNSSSIAQTFSSVGLTSSILLNSSSSQIQTTNQVVSGNKVSVNYIGKFQDGKVFDTSLENIAKSAGIYNSARPYSPLAFTVGGGEMIKGFDEALVGMKVGETKTITLPPEKAYGNPNPDLIKSLPLEQFKQAGLDPKLGDEIPVGPGVACKVVGVYEKEAKIDCNSPMAGKTLVFDITLVSIN